MIDDNPPPLLTRFEERSQENSSDVRFVSLQVVECATYLSVWK